MGIGGISFGRTGAFDGVVPARDLQDWNGQEGARVLQQIEATRTKVSRSSFLERRACLQDSWAWAKLNRPQKWTRQFGCVSVQAIIPSWLVGGWHVWANHSVCTVRNWTKSVWWSALMANTSHGKLAMPNCERAGSAWRQPVLLKLESVDWRSHCFDFLWTGSASVFSHERSHAVSPNDVSSSCCWSHLQLPSSAPHPRLLEQRNLWGSLHSLRCGRSLRR